jgi:16S rRNA processing protein RimM
MPTTDEPGSRFHAGAELLLDDSPCRVVDSRLRGPRVDLLLEGVSDREEAEGLRGRWLFADLGAAQRPADAEEFYDHQLEGLQVTVGDRAVGVVTGVLHLPGQDVLEVTGTLPGPVLVPFVADIVREVDLAAGTLVVDPPDGMFDDAG